MLFLFFCCGVPAAWSAPLVLVYGDSLSAAYGMPRNAGWPSLLERRLGEQRPPWRVANASVSGETSAGGLARLPALLDRLAPDLVILALGANDGLRGLPTARMADNLRAMVRLAKGRGARVLLVGMRLPPNYGSAYTREFQDVFVRLAQQEDVPLVPFLLDGIATDPSWFQADGLHPTAEAQPRLLDTVWRGLAPLLARQAAPIRASRPAASLRPGP